MKRITITFSIGLFLLFTLSTSAFAQHKSLSQGMYSITDAKLQPGINYKVRNASTNKSLLLVIDSNQSIQQLMRLDPTSPEYTLKPFNSDDIIVVIGSAKLEFS